MGILKRFLGIFILFFYLHPLMADNIIWTFPSAISSPNQDVSDPKVGIDSNGDVIAIWIENGFVIASSLPYNGSWSYPTTISAAGASSPQLAVDVNGNATAVWVENGVVNTATQPAGGSWGTAQVLSSSGASSPQIAFDANGNVAAVWVLDGVIQSATCLFGRSWQATPDTISNGGMDSPQVAIGGNENVIVVWHGTLDSMDTVFTANKSINGTWNAPEPISSLTDSCAYPKLDVDANGNAIVIWFRFEVANTAYSHVVVQSTSCPYGGSWTIPVDLSREGIYNPGLLTSDVDYDGNGNAVATWNTSFDGSSFFYEVALLPVGGTWSLPLDLLGQDSFAYAIDLAVDAFGHAFAVYMGSANPSSIKISYSKIDIFAYRPGWSSPYITLSQGSYNGFPQAVALSIGNQIYSAAVWLSYNGQNATVVAASGTGTIFTPPSNLSVVQNVNDYFVFQQYYNTLSWQPSTNLNVTGYYLFRNGQSLGSVPANVTQFVDVNRSPSESVTYGVAAFSNDFSQSQMVSITYP
jgi:hypothetical protein